MKVVAASFAFVSSWHRKQNCQFRPVETQFIRKTHKFGIHNYPSDLDTAYEWLANDRFSKNPLGHNEIKWFSPSNIDKCLNESDGISLLEKMPLYPLGQVHLPFSGENHTLINIEERNVKMSRDLIQKKWKNNLFCVSLRARDTNRIASVGTVMELIQAEDRSISGFRSWNGEPINALNRVVLTCKAVAIADIVSVDNAHVWSDNYEGNEYLVANVMIRPFPNFPNEKAIDVSDDLWSEKTDTSYCMSSKIKSIGNQIISDYQRIKSIYSTSSSLASNELPVYAREAIRAIPEYDQLENFDDKAKFWEFLETWQRLCYTIRQARRSQLQSILNELSVEVAMQADGPLELPVKRSRLPENVQQKLLEMERSASRDYMELGMDPVLDFQELIAMSSDVQRLRKLAKMVGSELSRLETKISLTQAFLRTELGEMMDDIDWNGFR